MTDYSDSIKASLVAICNQRIANDEEFKEAVDVIGRMNVSHISESFEEHLYKLMPKAEIEAVENFLTSELYERYNRNVYRATANISKDIAALADCLCVEKGGVN